MMKKINKVTLCVLAAFCCCFCFIPVASALEEVITVPAESSQGVVLDLSKGEYLVKIEGGAMTLFYPINPNYRWLIGVAVGTDVTGNQDEPNLGTIYFDPKPLVNNQAEAERLAIEATNEKMGGTFLRFILKDNKKVRFWVSDFDYTDNSGMVKLKVTSLSN